MEDKKIADLQAEMNAKFKEFDNKLLALCQEYGVVLEPEIKIKLRSDAIDNLKKNTAALEEKEKEEKK